MHRKWINIPLTELYIRFSHYQIHKTLVRLECTTKVSNQMLPCRKIKSCAEAAKYLHLQRIQ